MSDQVDEKPTPYDQVYAHLDQAKRILEEWEQEEKALEERVESGGRGSESHTA